MWHWLWMDQLRMMPPICWGSFETPFFCSGGATGLLLAAGAEPHIKTDGGETALDKAKLEKSQECVDLLVSAAWRCRGTEGEVHLQCLNKTNEKKETNQTYYKYK